ncbi:MAG: amino acid adenylation domain-containing protein [Polyangiales bacterium]
MTRRLEHLFASWARRAPERMAVEGPDVQLSYGELSALADRFAHAFLASGVQPGDRIGIHLPRSGRGIAAMIGALRAGAVYVPLDPASPPSRMQLIVKDCGIQRVVIAPALLKNWVAQNVHEPVTDFFLSADGPIPSLPEGVHAHAWSALSTATAPEVPSRSSGPDELAYMLYTSGSTGVPKGVMLSHGNALAFVDWAADIIELSDKDRVASVAPFHFDLSVFDVWSSLSRGATLVIVDETTVVQGRRMLDLIRERDIHVWYSVPSAWTLMLETGGLAERGAPSLRVVYFAGEVFPMKHLRRTMQAVPNARFLNLFGPTETNVCLAYEVKGVPGEEQTSIPIGVPSCGDTIQIVDEQGKAVPEGQVGELLVDGPTVMLGYWDGGRRTPAKHPYPTGDLVSRLPSGDVMYHGRRDHMVKVHGYRIELGEVEATLHAHEGVKEAIAFAHDQKLVAVIVPSDPNLSVLGIKNHCATHIPRYMIPSDIRLVANLPRTSSGKIDRVRTKAAAIDNDASVLAPVRTPA